MAAYVNTTNSPQGTLPIISLGIRMAQDVGAHRKKMYSATPTVEQELWKRHSSPWIGWRVSGWDASASPTTKTSSASFDLDPMIECDDEYWTHPDPAQAFQQPPGKPSIVTFANTFIRLLKIQAFASRTIFTINKSKLLMGYVGPEWKQRIVADLDSSLNKWLDAVPPHLRWDPDRADDVFFNQSAILYSNYYVLQIFVHRPFIPSPRRPLASAKLSLPSMTICVNAARACLRVLEVQHRRSLSWCSGFTLYALTPLQMPLFEVGMMFLVYLWAGARDIETTLKDVNICLGILKDLSAAGNLVARKLGIILRAMCPPSSWQPQAQLGARARPPALDEPRAGGPDDDRRARRRRDAAAHALRLPHRRRLRHPRGPGARRGHVLFTAPPRDLAAPSPFVQAAPHATSAPAQTGMGTGTGTGTSAGSGQPFAGRDGWADQLKALSRDFVPTRFPSAPAPAASHDPPSLDLGLQPTYAPMEAPPEVFNFTFGNAFMADADADGLDLSVFGPLSSMFDNGQTPGLDCGHGADAPSPPATASSLSVFGPPQRLATPAPFRATPAGAVGGVEGWSPARLAEPANPAPMEVQSDGHGGGSQEQGQGPWQWQGLSAPQGEL
uniref:Candidapepsin-2 (Aspartate protease 2) (Secreted aspartic protease 2)) n=1 Tax=Ganoderma boninense TaxID=34458 RepID=A0A5K1K1F7_9APHY|nr:Candidapepsin-2 (EC (ACP 2) (Aspartate protease 2) (Secreted aspartic protease 2) [Ganoderma boninense]